MARPQRALRPRHRLQRPRDELQRQLVVVVVVGSRGRGSGCRGRRGRGWRVRRRRLVAILGRRIGIVGVAHQLLMLAAPEFLVARPVPALVPVEDQRGGLRVLIASLARGGAERIVLEWLDAEARRGRSVELAVLHPRANAWRAPAGVTLVERRGESTEAV